MFKPEVIWKQVMCLEDSLCGENPLCLSGRFIYRFSIAVGLTNASHCVCVHYSRDTVLNFPALRMRRWGLVMSELLVVWDG